MPHLLSLGTVQIFGCTIVLAFIAAFGIGALLAVIIAPAQHASLLHASLGAAVLPDVILVVLQLRHDYTRHLPLEVSVHRTAI
jgi:hypothetical protein